MKKTAAFFVFVILLATTIASGDDHDDGHDDDDDHHDEWCHDHTEHADHEPFSEIKEYLNINATNLKFSDLDTFVSMMLFRIRCDEREWNFTNPSMTCEMCLNASHIYSVLNLLPSDDLDVTLFEKAATIVVVFSYQIPEKCNTPPDWSTVTYHEFAEELVAYHPDQDDHDDDDHDDDADDDDDEEHEHGALSPHQLELLLTEVGETYRPGVYVIPDPDVDVVCKMNTSESFRSRDIIKSMDLEHPEEGIPEENLGKMSLDILSRLLQGDCIQPDRSQTDGLPDEHDFLKAIFSTFAHNNGTCVMGKEGFHELLDALSIQEEDSHAEPHGDEDSDEHDDHNHEVASTRMKRAADDHDDDHDDHDDHDSFLPDVKYMCMSSEDILNTFYMNAEDVEINEEDFVRLCPALLQQSVQGCTSTHESEHGEGTVRKATNLEKYGYGTLAALLVSACAAFGLVLVQARGRRAYVYVLTIMLGLALGTLVGDALLHLIPHALGMHAHDDDAHAHSADEGIVVDMFVWKMLCACASVWAFFLIQMSLLLCGGGHSHTHNHEHSHDEDYVHTTSSNTTGSYELNGGQENLAYQNDKFQDHTESNGYASKEKEAVVDIKDKKNNPDKAYTHPSVAWMISIGDAIHNLADGLAMGAAFSMDWRTGLSTSIAVFCHELPHEFGDVGILLSCGWSLKKVALFQLVSASTCFVGLYIGIAISETEVAREWVFIVAAGMFLYISLSDVVPELLETIRSDRSPGKICLMANIGILFGFGLMLVIAIFEESIAI